MAAVRVQRRGPRAANATSEEQKENACFPRAKRRRRAPATRRGAAPERRGAGRTRAPPRDVVCRIGGRGALSPDPVMVTVGKVIPNAVCFMSLAHCSSPPGLWLELVLSLSVRIRFSPIDSRGVKVHHLAPPVRFCAAPAPARIRSTGETGGSETDGGNNQGFGIRDPCPRTPASRVRGKARSAHLSHRRRRRERHERENRSGSIASMRERCRARTGLVRSPGGLAAAGLAAACAGARATGLGPSSPSRRANMFAPEKAMALGSNGS